MPHHIFFSWQADTQTGVGRNMIERALERAIGEIGADAEIDAAIREELAVDRDTKDVAGSPPVMEVIFEKIDEAAVFLADLTYVAQRDDGRRMPNPNVLTEYGWALKALGWRRIVAVMNTAMGHPDKHPLPFDLGHFRRPIFFDCAPTTSIEERAAAKAALAKDLQRAVGLMLKDEKVLASLKPAAPLEAHPHDIDLLAHARRQLPGDLRRFLVNHDFGQPFRRAVLDPLDEMNHDWVGAQFEFHDGELQKSFGLVRELSAALGELVGRHIYAMDENMAYGTAKTDQDRARGMQQSTLDGIKAMNGKAQELAGAIDTFERLARDRVRVRPQAAAVEASANAAELAARAGLRTLAEDRARGGVPQIVSTPRLTLRLAPLALAQGRRLDAKAVREVQEQLFPPNVRENVETQVDQRQWWSYAPPRRVDGPNPESRWLTRLVRPGLLEFQATIAERIDDDPDIAVEGKTLEARIVHGMQRLGIIAEKLGLGGPALGTVTIEGAEDLVLLRPRGGGRRIRQPEIALPEFRVEKPGGQVAPALQDTLDMIWQASGWPDGSPSFGEGGWAGYTDRRNYPVDGA